MTRFLSVLFLCAAFFASGGCGAKNIDAYTASAAYIEENRVPVSCGTAADNTARGLAARRDDALLFGGDFTQLEPQGEECARFVLERAVSGGTVAVITLEPADYREARLTIYQQYGSRGNRDLVAAIIKMAEGDTF